ncbi:MAG: N-acetylneuraminate synthase [Rhodospirillaceae bacterium]|nr:N-acetylneuraminate synthase [Rhodospirillaceae bacterium]
MIIGRTDLGRHVYVVAEIGGNHNGDSTVALRLVEEAAGAGADAVKFQTYDAGSLIHPNAAPMPMAGSAYRSQFERFKSLELPPETYDRIIDRCAGLGIDFLTTPFALDILDAMAPRMPAIKIASGDLTFHQLIRAGAATGKPVLLSTGMSTLDEVAVAAALVPAERLVLLHCVSLYPLPDEDANLLALKTMRARFPDVTLGYSDHTIGAEAPIVAVALGARVIEKHFTLDSNQRPGDHPLSLDPVGMAGLVTSIRRIERMLGNGQKIPAPGEDAMRRRMRRGLYAARDLDAGHRIAETDIKIIRPEGPLSPADAPHLSGRRLRRRIAAFEALTPEAIE